MAAHQVKIETCGSQYGDHVAAIMTHNGEFLLTVGQGDNVKTYRFDIKDDNKLGIHLMNGVDLKVTNPPAFSYPSPYIVLG